MKIKEEKKILMKMIDENDVISFDIYDTALLRNVLNPIDIFDVVDRKLKNEKIYTKINFKDLRIKAEIHARKKTKSEEVTLEDIYSSISDKIGKELADRIKEIELSIEWKFTKPNPFIKEIYDYAQLQNKKVVFISDMYLNKDFISELLKYNGYKNYDYLFVSSEIGLSKASSNLYKYAVDYIGNKYRWIHIGDNYRSDFENAIRSGINAYHYKAIRERIPLIKNKYSLEYSIMKAIQINYSKTKSDITYWERFGVEVISPIFFGFITWLTEQLKGKENVFFLSRDGYLPYKIYQKVSKYHKHLPPAQYLYASRAVYQITNILNMAPNEAIELLVHINDALGHRVYLHEIMSILGLDITKYQEILDEYGFKQHIYSIEVKGNEKKIEDLLMKIYPDITLKLKEKEKLLLQYLNDNGFNNFDEINIVDIGWRGSTQKAIKDITKKNVKGYYFGTGHNVYDDIKKNVYSYTFHLGKPFKLMGKIMGNVMMYELIFSAPHGSLIDFQQQENGDIVPKLANVEKNEYLYKAILQFQSGVLFIYDHYMEYYDYLVNINKHDCLFDYFRFMEDQNFEDLLHFERLTNTVGFGQTEVSQKYVTRIRISKYKKERNKIRSEAKRNLWKNAIILEGSAKELLDRRLPKIESSSFELIWSILFKAIKDPKKAINRLRMHLQNKNSKI